MLVPFLVVPYVYRVLNPEVIGNIEYGATLYSYFGLLGALGIYNYGLREISRVRNDLSKVRTLYKNLFVTGLISNLFFFAIYILFVFFFIHDSALKEIMYITGLTLVAQTISIEWINEAYEEFRFITVKTVIIRSLNVLLMFLLVRNVGDYPAYVWIITLYWFFNYIISFVYGQKHVRLSWKETFSGLDLRRYIAPLFFILILNNTVILYTAADRTMLGAFCGTEEVAYYSIGQKIIEIIKMLLLSAVYVTLPRLSLYLEQDKNAYLWGVQKLMRMLLMIVFPVAIGMFMLSEEVVLLFAGKQYLDAIPSLRIFAMRIIIVSIESILYNQIIFLHRREKLLVILNLICGGLNVLLNFAFLKYLDPVVAISTTLFSEIIFQILCLVYIKRKLHISTGLFDKRNLKYVVGALTFIPIILIIKYLINNQVMFVVMSIILCIFVYILILIISKDEFYCEIRERLLIK